MGRLTFEVVLVRILAMGLITFGILGVCGTVTGLVELAGGARTYVQDSDDQEQAKRDLVLEGLSRALGFVSVLFLVVGILMFLASFDDLRNKGL